MQRRVPRLAGPAARGEKCVYLISVPSTLTHDGSIAMRIANYVPYFTLRYCTSHLNTSGAPEGAIVLLDLCVDLYDRCGLGLS